VKKIYVRLDRYPGIGTAIVGIPLCHFAGASPPEIVGSGEAGVYTSIRAMIGANHFIMPTDEVVWFVFVPARAA